MHTEFYHLKYAFCFCKVTLNNYIALLIYFLLMCVGDLFKSSYINDCSRCGAVGAIITRRLLSLIVTVDRNLSFKYLFAYYKLRI